MDQEGASVLYVYMRTRKEEYHVHSLDWLEELTRPWSRTRSRICSRITYFGPEAMPEIHFSDQENLDRFHAEVVNHGGVYLGPGRTVCNHLDPETEGELGMDGELESEHDGETAVETETEAEVEVEVEVRTII